jgi:hypothetical protein
MDLEVKPVLRRTSSLSEPVSALDGKPPSTTAFTTLQSRKRKLDQQYNDPRKRLGVEFDAHYDTDSPIPKQEDAPQHGFIDTANATDDTGGRAGEDWPLSLHLLPLIHASMVRMEEERPSLPAIHVENDVHTHEAQKLSAINAPWTSDTKPADSFYTSGLGFRHNLVSDDLARFVRRSPVPSTISSVASTPALSVASRSSVASTPSLASCSPASPRPSSVMGPFIACGYEDYSSADLYKNHMRTSALEFTTELLINTLPRHSVALSVENERIHPPIPTLLPETLSQTTSRERSSLRGSPLGYQPSGGFRILRRGPWTQEEDQTLLQLVGSEGPNNWVRISQHMCYRSPKQCRERYHQNLKASLNHDPITQEEDILIERMVKDMGKRWAEIAHRLGQRSDNAVKNWWNGSMNRRKRCRIQPVEQREDSRYTAQQEPLSFAKTATPAFSLDASHPRQQESLLAATASLPLLASLVARLEDMKQPFHDVHESKIGNDRTSPQEPLEFHDSANSDTEEACDHCCSALAHQTQDVLTRLMTDVYALFRYQWGKKSATQHGSSSSGSPTDVNTTNAASGSDQGVSKEFIGKRKRQGRDDSPPRGGKGNNGKRPRSAALVLEGGLLTRRFACPYFKRDSITYSLYGSCTGPGFKTTSRVKLVFSVHDLRSFTEF